MDFIPKRILLIQFRQLGDVLLGSSAAAVLKANFPGAKLDFLTQPPSAQALERNPAIDNILVYDSRKALKWILEVRRRGYDLVIDFMSNPRSALVAAMSGARVKAGPAYTCSSWAYNFKLEIRPGQREYNPFFKIDLVSQLGLENIFYPYPECRPAAADLRWAADAVAGLAPGRPLIFFSPASRRATRRWPARYYASLASLVTLKTGAAVLVLWGPGEKPLAQDLVRAAASPLVFLSPETATLSKLSALLKQAALLVSNCNGARHIALASGVPTLAIHGSSRPQSWTPPSDRRHQTIRSEALACIACQKNECPDIACLENLSPQSVFAKLIAMAGELGLGI